MKTKAKSVQVFEVRLWSRKHYGNKKTTQQNNIYQGSLTECKSRKGGWFRSPAKLLTLLEKLYLEAEKR